MRPLPMSSDLTSLPMMSSEPTVFWPASGPLTAQAVVPLTATKSASADVTLAKDRCLRKDPIKTP